MKRAIVGGRRSSRAKDARHSADAFVGVPVTGIVDATTEVTSADAVVEDEDDVVGTFMVFIMAYMCRLTL